MNDITLNISIPQLDRLCEILEGKAAPSAAPAPAPAAPEMAPVYDKELPWAADSEGRTVTLDDLKRACAALRDQQKMGDVKALFGEFGIKKLSDLTEQTQIDGFAAKLRQMGASV